MDASRLSSVTVRVVAPREGNHRSQEWAGVGGSQPSFRDVELCM